MNLIKDATPVGVKETSNADLIRRLFGEPPAPTETPPVAEPHEVPEPAPREEVAHAVSHPDPAPGPGGDGSEHRHPSPDDHGLEVPGAQAPAADVQAAAADDLTDGPVAQATVVPEVIPPFEDLTRGLLDLDAHKYETISYLQRLAQDPANARTLHDMFAQGELRAGDPDSEYAVVHGNIVPTNPAMREELIDQELLKGPLKRLERGRKYLKRGIEMMTRAVTDAENRMAKRAQKLVRSERGGTQKQRALLQRASALQIQAFANAENINDIKISNKGTFLHLGAKLPRQRIVYTTISTQRAHAEIASELFTHFAADIPDHSLAIRTATLINTVRRELTGVFFINVDGNIHRARVWLPDVRDGGLSNRTLSSSPVSYDHMVAEIGRDLVPGAGEATCEMKLEYIVRTSRKEMDNVLPHVGTMLNELPVSLKFDVSQDDDLELDFEEWVDEALS